MKKYKPIVFLRDSPSYMLSSSLDLRGWKNINNQGYIFVCSSPPCSQWLHVYVFVSSLLSSCTRAGDELNEWRAEH